MLFYSHGTPGADWANLLAQRDEADGLKYYNVFSNLAFLVTAGMLAYRRRRLETILVLFVFLFSSSYHVCLAFNECAGMPLAVTRNQDWLCADLLGIVFFTMLARSRDEDDPGHPLHAWAVDKGHAQYVETVATTLILVVALALLAHPFDIYDAYVTIVGGLVSLVFWVLFFRQPANLMVTDEGFVSEPIKVNVGWFIGSLLALAGGIVLFVVPLPNSAGHATWHILAAFAVIAWSEALTPSNWPQDAPVRVLEYMNVNKSRAMTSEDEEQWWRQVRLHLDSDGDEEESSEAATL
jgi:hypothetical protein